MNKKGTVFNLPNVRRRDFLKMFGLTIGGLAVSKIPFATGDSAYLKPAGMPKLSKLPTIGLLVPNGGLYPQLGNNIAMGMKLALDEADENGYCNPDKLRIIELGTGANEAIGKVKTLLTKDKVDIIAGVMNPVIADRLHETLEKNRTFLILTEAGANVIRNNEFSPYIFHNNLGYWRSNVAAGEWAVRNIGKKVFVASSFYESGYDALYAFNLGVDKAGGKILQTYVSHVPPNKMEMNFLMEAIRKANPDFVFASYSGGEAVEFAHAFSSSFTVNKIPLVGSSIMAENFNIDNHTALLPGMISCSSWSPQLNTKENHSFKNAFKKNTGRPADSFAVLGYDTGCLIVEAANSAGSDLRNVTKVRDALRSAVIKSPRGILRMDSLTHNIQSPLYLQEVRVNTNGVTNHFIDELRPVTENYHALETLRNETRTGWLNAYLNV